MIMGRKSSAEEKRNNMPEYISVPAMPASRNNWGVFRSFLVLTCSAWLLFAADSEPRWRVLNREARQAMDAKDYSKLRGTLQELEPLMPGNPRIIYNLAAADAVLGNTQAA